MKYYHLYLEGFDKPVKILAAKFETRGDWELFFDKDGNTVFMAKSSKVTAFDLSLAPEPQV